MTPRRMMTSLSAVALGFALAGAVPALAQTNTQTAAPPAPAAPAPAAPAPAAPAAPANPGPSATTNSNMPGNTAQAPSKHGQMQTMNHKPKSTTHHVATRGSSRRYASSESNPNAQNGAVDQLNQQSLQAAQQGRSYAPAGHM